MPAVLRLLSTKSLEKSGMCVEICKEKWKKKVKAEVLFANSSSVCHTVCNICTSECVVKCTANSKRVITDAGGTHVAAFCYSRLGQEVEVKKAQEKAAKKKWKTS